MPPAQTPTTPDAAAAPPSREPWRELAALLETGDGAQITAFVDALPREEWRRTISRLPEAKQMRLLDLLGPGEAADLLDDLLDSQTTGILECLPVERAAAIVSEMSSGEQAAILGGLDAKDAEAILRQMKPDRAADARMLLQFAPGTAGALMVREFLAYSEHLRVEDVLNDLRMRAAEYADYDIQYAYILDARGRLTGVLRLRDLLLAPRSSQVSALMIRNPVRVRSDMPLDALGRFFDEHSFLGAPVVEPAGRMLGVVARDAVRKAVAQQATTSFLKFSGLGGEEELRSMPLFRRSFRRLSWLTINIGLNLGAALVIAMYQDTLSAVIALAVFLPIISDMSGCSGNQAVAVSMRELTLGLVKPYELFRVLTKEMAVGIVNGLVLGLILGALALLWKGNPYLGLVVGGALMLNTVVAVLIGGSIPLLLKRMKLDPALASGPILTTVTDMCGFFLVLSFASAVLSRLTV